MSPMRQWLMIPAMAALLCVPAAAAQSRQAGPAPGADETRVARLAELGRVWGTVRYFHPYLAYRPIDWDRALVEAIPRVSAATSRQEYRAALDRMLGSLGDPDTRVEVGGEAGRGRAPASTAVRGPVTIEDGVLRMELMRVAEASAANVDVGDSMVNRAVQLLPEAVGIVLDLRGAERSLEGDTAGALFYFEYHLGGLASRMLDTVVQLGSQRSRMHSGYVPQADFTSGGYYSAFATYEPVTLTGLGRTRTPPMVLVVDAWTPSGAEFVSGLRAAGRAVVVRDGTTGGEPGIASHAIRLGDGLRVRMRTAEIVNPDGSVGFRADTVVAIDGELDAAIREALRRARHPAPGRPAGGAPPATAMRSQRDDPYPQMEFPDTEHRLLALFRFWNVVRYFFPYKHLIDEPWDSVLPRYIPRFEANRDAADYQQTVRELVAEIQDSHAGVGGATRLADRRGRHYPPFAARFVEGQTLVTHVFGAQSGIRVGDVVLAVDGDPVERYRERFAVGMSASTPQALQRDLHRQFGRGHENTRLRLTLRSPEGVVREVETTRSIPGTDPRRAQTAATNRSTPVFGVLDSGFGYVDLQRLEVGDVDRMFGAIRNTPATIFDMRGYPNGTAWSIAPRLTERRNLTSALASRPLLDARKLDDLGAGYSFHSPWPESRGAPYRGKVVMLIDEYAQSQSESTAMMFEAATDVVFVGTPTAGANGDVTFAVLPGNLVVPFSGHDVRHADGRQLQRMGVQPDVRVAPTIRGLLAGRDEVLEAAVAHLRSTLGSPKR